MKTKGELTNFEIKKFEKGGDKVPEYFRTDPRKASF